MKVETNNIPDAYQQQIATMREISEAFLEGTGRMENMWLEQTRKIFKEQLKFFHATTAIREPKELAALHSAFFSHSPEELIKAQQQILSVVTETQTKINEVLSKHIGTLKIEDKSLRGAMNTTGGATGLAETCYSAWHKAFQDTMELASLGAKALPLSAPEPSNTPPTSKKGSAHAKG